LKKKVGHGFDSIHQVLIGWLDGGRCGSKGQGLSRWMIGEVRQTYITREKSVVFWKVNKKSFTVRSLTCF